MKHPLVCGPRTFAVLTLLLGAFVCSRFSRKTESSPNSLSEQSITSNTDVLIETKPGVAARVVSNQEELESSSKPRASATQLVEGSQGQNRLPDWVRRPTDFDAFVESGIPPTNAPQPISSQQPLKTWTSAGDPAEEQSTSQTNRSLAMTQARRNAPRITSPGFNDTQAPMSDSGGIDGGVSRSLHALGVDPVGRSNSPVSGLAQYRSSPWEADQFHKSFENWQALGSSGRVGRTASIERSVAISWPDQHIEQEELERLSRLEWKGNGLSTSKPDHSILPPTDSHAIRGPAYQVDTSHVQKARIGATLAPIGPPRRFVFQPGFHPGK